MSRLSGDQLKKLGFVFAVLLSLCFKIVASKCHNDCDLALASYYVLPGATLLVIGNYLNTSVNDIMSYNSDEIHDQDSVQSGIRINVPFPCGCVNYTFLRHVFSYQFQKGDSYDTVAQNNYTNLTTESWIQQNYNPGVDFNAGTGVVFIPGKDKSGKYPPLGSNKSASASSAYEPPFDPLIAKFEDVLNLPDPNEICKLVDLRLGDDYPLDLVRQVAELAKACTQENPQLRPSMRSVVVALTTLLSTTESWDIDSFYGTIVF